MNTILIVVLMGVFGYSLFHFSSRLSNKKIDNTTSDQFQPLIDELKNIDKMTFKTVSANVIYSNTFAVLFKAMGYLVTFAAIALCLDLLTIRHFSIDIDDLMISMIFYIFGSFIVFVLPLLSCTWDYIYFKYGLSDQVKNSNFLLEYINKIPNQIIKKYTFVFIGSYIIGRLFFGFGYLSVLVGTGVYELAISIYFALEVKRIGFAPVFNLFTEKLNEFKGEKNAK